MSEQPACDALSPFAAEAITPCDEALQALRKEGAAHMDPVRFRYIEVLCQRVQTAPAAVRPVLESRLQMALQDYRTRFGRSRTAAEDAVATLSIQRPDLARELQRLLSSNDHPGVRRLGTCATMRTGCPPLAKLNADLNRIARAGVQGEPGGAGVLGSDHGAISEMKSVRRFREVWSRISANDQVDQALSRGPDNAGPLNSHRLVVRSLEWMRRLSPDYLQRFLLQADALLWLEQASQKYAPTEAKPARKGRKKGQG